MLPDVERLTRGELAALIAEHPDHAYVAMELDGTLLDWGRAAHELFGWTAEQALGRRMIELTVPPDQHDALSDNDAAHATLEKGRLRSRRFEVINVDRHGRRFPCEIRCYPLEADGATTLHAFIRDLSARPSSGPDRRLAAIVESSADAILAIDADYLITDWNPAAERLFGYKRAAIVGLPASMIVPPPLRGQSLATWRVTQHASGFVRVDTQRRHRDGRLLDVELTATRIEGPEQAAWCSATYRDISERRRAERGLAELADRLRARSEAEREVLPGDRTPRVAPPDEPERALVEQVLELVREHLTMDVAWLAEVTDEHQVFDVVVGMTSSYGLAAGDTVPRSETLCARVVSGEAGELHPDARNDPELSDLPAVQRMGVGAYIGVPVRLRDGRPYGTLCAVDHRPRPDLSQRDVRLMRLLAVLLGDRIDRERVVVGDQRAATELAAMGALHAALDARDQYTVDHSQAVVALARAVAGELGCDADEVATIGQVAMLHDIGKVGIPDATLHKPGALTELEWALMREHSAIGARIVAAIAPLAHLAPAVRAEHERYDGGGYPDGLAGERIPLAARITLACDAYHAMISDRPYRRALGHDAAIAQLSEHAGSQLDPAVVDALVAVLGR